MVSSSQIERTQFYPGPGMVEHDPIEIWRTTVVVIEDALTKANLNASSISAIGITNQRETTVVWNRFIIYIVSTIFS